MKEPFLLHACWLSLVGQFISKSILPLPHYALIAALPVSQASRRIYLSSTSFFVCMKPSACPPTLEELGRARSR
jgi:hypothetical protein